MYILMYVCIYIYIYIYIYVLMPCPAPGRALAQGGPDSHFVGIHYRGGCSGSGVQ